MEKIGIPYYDLRENRTSWFLELRQAVERTLNNVYGKDRDN
jgi:hypothetical protein